MTKTHAAGLWRGALALYVVGGIWVDAGNEGARRPGTAK